MRYGLGALLALVALNAFAGGYYALAGAKDWPLQWLEGSPFRSFVIPGLVLFIVVGGSCLLASIAVFAGWARARLFALAAAVILFGWIAVQLSIIGYVSPLQPLMLGISLVIAGLAQALGAQSPEGRRSSTGARPAGKITHA